ncbi:uncharacterized protein TrAtP1_009154 [Trichoderma atroviride]|uniref:uncharacterized protein n=1 Tax=Hypocrea atroviridis TaxID=63577 RepID=UPI00331911E2|nr:hypothetical protein TrAtP1_009154 [Trichoderma atroviride]
MASSLSRNVTVAAVNHDGKGYFEADLSCDTTILPGGGNLRSIFEVSRIPIPGLQYNAKDEYSGLSNNTGVRFIESEMAPGERSPMQATPSVDLGVIITGTITLMLDSGGERTLE